MSNYIYCVEKIKGEQLELKVAENKTVKLPAKRVNVISIKMVREASILYDGRKINSPEDAAELGKKFLEEADREQMILCCLDTKNQPVSISVISIGSLNSSIVHPREVFKSAILSNAASIILYHNHPSGDPSPSQEDINITKRLIECGKLIGIDVLDHLIIGQDNRFCSLKERGVM